MKLLILASLLFISNISRSQSTFESSYVVDGQSFKMTIPKEFHLIGELDEGMIFYSMNPDLIFNDGSLGSDCIMIGIMPNEEEITIEEAMAEVTKQNSDEIVNLKKITTDGGEFILGSADFGLGIEGVTLSDFGMTIFEDVLVLIAYVDLEDDSHDPKLIKNIVNSYLIYETNRENEYDPYADYDYSEDYEEITGFKNSLYDTRLTYDEVFFDPWNELEEDTDWYEDFDEDFLELLTAYEFLDYDQENPLVQGGIKFFSGGFADNFKREVDQLEALKRVFPDYLISDIEFEKEVEGDEFTFKRYKITSLSKSNNAFAYYSTTYQGELLFFMVYEEWQPSDQFKNEYEDVIKTFFIIEEE